MKISYVLQLKDFLIMFVLGLIVGIIYGLINNLIIHKKTIFQIIIDFFLTLFASSILLIFMNIINSGEFRLFLILGYIIGFAIERITIGKIFAKGFKKLYTCQVNILKKFANSRLGRIIFK